MNDPLEGALWRIIQGDALAVLPTLPAGCVQQKIKEKSGFGEEKVSAACLLMNGPGKCCHHLPALTTSTLALKGHVMATDQSSQQLSRCHYACEWCGKVFYRPGRRTIRFCSIPCKAEWQKTQKPVDKEWLWQKYIVEGLGTYEIAKLVNRNPKQVWHWLKGYKIPLRERTWDAMSTANALALNRTVQPYRQEAWLWTEYVFKGRTAAEIAAEFGVTAGAILFHLKSYGIPRRDMAETRAIKYWGACGPANGMYGLRGLAVPSWKGGCTPERQAFYSTREWQSAARAVKKRDKNTCQRCEATKASGAKLEIHHIVSFAVVALRADVNNLVLLCQHCHDFVHSKANANGEFIVDYQGEFIRVD